MTRDELIENVGEAVVYDLSDRRGFRHLIDDLDAEVLADIRGTVGAAALAVIVEWLEGEAKARRDLAAEMLHHTVGQVSDVYFAEVEASNAIRRLITMLKEPAP